MTKEELEKEARKYVKQNYCEMCVMADDCKSGCIDCFTVQAYLASAESREKQIAELKDEVHTWKEASSTNSYKAFQLQEANNTLSKHIVELQNDKGELTDRCRELEVQIEKMKNWCNCKNYKQCLIELAEQGKGMKPSECCVNCKKWELEDYKTRHERRNKEIKEND